MLFVQACVNTDIFEKLRQARENITNNISCTSIAQKSNHTKAVSCTKVQSCTKDDNSFLQSSASSSAEKSVPQNSASLRKESSFTQNSVSSLAHENSDDISEEETLNSKKSQIKSSQILYLLHYMQCTVKFSIFIQGSPSQRRSLSPIVKSNSNYNKCVLSSSSNNKSYKNQEAGKFSYKVQ